MDQQIRLFRSAKLSQEELRVIEAIAQAHKDLKYSLSSPSRWPGVLRRNAFAQAIKGSNSIEGYNVTVEDAIAAAENEPPAEAQTDTWHAIMGYRDALTYVLQLARDPHFSFNDGFIRGFHFMMMKHELDKNPGNWRPGAIYVRDEKKNEKVYEGPPASQVSKLVSELVKYLNGPIDNDHILIKGAMAHLNLVMIHPFSDGNGRMARCLQTLVIALKGVVDPTFCSIEEYLGSNTEAYYHVLGEVGQGSWHPENDTRPWIRFNLTAHYRQALTALRRTRTISKLFDTLERELQDARLNERMIYALADGAVGMKLRAANYRHMADVSDVVASRDLKALVRAGFLIPQGERRGRIYRGSDHIRQIWIQIRQQEPKSIADPFVEPPMAA